MSIISMIFMLSPALQVAYIKPVIFVILLFVCDLEENRLSVIQSKVIFSLEPTWQGAEFKSHVCSLHLNGQ